MPRNWTNSTRSMASKYFISAFLEVESIDTGNEIARDLARVGNLFDTEEQARKVLHILKYKIGRDEREVQGHIQV
jgi:hypothetical protein